MTENTAPAGSTRETARLVVADDEGVVTVRKLVSKGERLAIASDGDNIKLDSLLLEGLTWQPDREALYDLLDGDGDVSVGEPADDRESPAEPTGERESPAEPEGTDASGTDAEDANGTDAEISVSNEYSHVTARAVETARGEALSLEAPGRGTAITLDAGTLRDLAAVEDTYLFSVWFETPFSNREMTLS